VQRRFGFFDGLRGESMKRTNAWAAAAVVALATTALVGRFFERQSARPSPEAPRHLSAVGRALPPNVLAQRVTDATSPEYGRWRAAARAAHWGLGAVMEALDSDLSPLQKSVVLSSLMDDLASLSPEERARLQERLASAVLSEELDGDLSDTIGRALRVINTSEQQQALEHMYFELDEQLEGNNKSAIVDASGSRVFVASVMTDSTQPLHVREQAIERAGDLGASAELLKFAERGVEPELRVTALRSLGQTADDAAALEATIDAASDQPDIDSYGRDTLAAARVGASESNVPGKSLVLCADWRGRALAAGALAEQELVRALVSGKALARALLSDEDGKAAARCIDDQIAPLVSGLGGVPVVEVQRLQLLAELATDLKSECSLRPPPSCSDPSDRRARFMGELARAVLPLLPGTGLEHYATLLATR
jgi:hypothetical protein